MHVSWLIAIFFTIPCFSATWNGVSISEAEIKAQQQRDRDSGTQSSRQSVLRRLVLFRLALREAQKQEIHLKPEVSRELDQVLYKHFLQHSLKQAKVSFKPSKKELKRIYERSPLVQVKHLVLVARNTGEKALAKKKLEKISAALNKGKSFQSLILQYSQDPSAKLLGGNLDYMGIHNFSKELYVKALALQKNKVSEPIFFQDAIHLIQVTNTKDFANAEATYLQFLKDDFRSRRESKHLDSLFQKLERKAKAETIGSTETS